MTNSFVNDDNETVSDKTKIPESFAECFSSVYDPSYANDTTWQFGPLVNNLPIDIPNIKIISVEEVLRYIKKLKPKRSYGPVFDSALCSKGMRRYPLDTTISTF